MSDMDPDPLLDNDLSESLMVLGGNGGEDSNSSPSKQPGEDNNEGGSGGGGGGNDDNCVDQINSSSINTSYEFRFNCNAENGIFPLGFIAKKSIRQNHPMIKKGSGWISELNLSKYNHDGYIYRYNFKNNSLYNVGGSLYLTDVISRVIRVIGTYNDIKADRGPHQAKVGKLGGQGYVGGHLIRSSNGGSGHAINIVPMNKIINQSGGIWFEMETEIGNHFKKNNLVKFNININYPDGLPLSLVPSSFDVTVYLKDDKLIEYPRIDNQLIKRTT